MNYTVKLLIPILLGAAAAGVNWVMLATRAEKIAFVSVSAPGGVEPGHKFADSDFSPVAVPKDFAGLAATAVPWEERGGLFGDIAQRTLKQGDLVFYRDTTRGLKPNLLPGEELFFVRIGEAATIPQLLSIGKMVHFRVSTTDAKGAWAGPFRVVSIDGRVEDDRLAQQTEPKTLAVAYNTRPKDAKEQEAIKMLEDFCDRQILQDAQLLSVRVEQ